MKRPRPVLYFVLMVGFALGSSVARASSVLRFEDLPSLLRELNQHSKSADKQLEASEALTPGLLQPFYPTITAEIGAERFQRELLPTRQDPYGSVEAEVNLFRGGKDHLRRQTSTLELRKAQLGAGRVYLDELSKARAAYIALIYAEALHATLKEAQELNEKNWAAASRRRSSGISTDTDLFEFEIKRQSIEQDRQGAELQITTQSLNLAVLLGLESLQSRNFQWPKDFGTVKIDLKHLQNPKTQTLALQIESIENDIEQIGAKVASRWWVPDVDLYAGYNLSSMRESDEFRRMDRDEVYGGIRAKFTLLDGGESLRRQKAHRLSAEASRLKLRQSALEDQAQLQIALESIRRNEGLIVGAQKSTQSAEKYLKQTLSEYSRGVKNSPDVSSATDKYIESQTRLLSIQRDYYLAMSEWLASLGPALPENK